MVSEGLFHEIANDVLKRSRPFGGRGEVSAEPGACQKRFQPGGHLRNAMKSALGDDELDDWVCRCHNDEAAVTHRSGEETC